MKDVDYGRPRKDTCEYNPILELERNRKLKGVEGVVHRIKDYALFSSVRTVYTYDYRYRM
jgi:hypothetical protein